MGPGVVFLQRGIGAGDTGERGLSGGRGAGEAACSSTEPADAESGRGQVLPVGLQDQMGAGGKTLAKPSPGEERVQ